MSVKLTSVDVEGQGFQADERQLDQRLNQRSLSCAGRPPEQQRAAVSVCLIWASSHWTQKCERLYSVQILANGSNCTPSYYFFCPFLTLIPAFFSSIFPPFPFSFPPYLSFHPFIFFSPSFLSSVPRQSDTFTYADLSRVSLPP